MGEKLNIQYKPPTSYNYSICENFCALLKLLDDPNFDQIR